MAQSNKPQQFSLGEEVFESRYYQLLKATSSERKSRSLSRHATYYLTVAARYTNEIRDHIVLHESQITLAANRICTILGKETIEALSRPKPPVHYPEVNELAASVAISTGLATRFYVFRHRIDGGLLWLHAGLAAARVLHDKTWEGNFLSDIGLWHKERGNDQDALSYYEQDLSISQAQENTSGVAAIYNNIGTMYLGRAQPRQALEYFDKALEHYDDSDDAEEIAATLGNLSLALLDLERFDDALSACERARRLQHQADDKVGLATTLNNIGLIHSARGQYELALDAYQHALHIRERLGNQEEIGTTLSNISAIYWEQDNPLVAIEYLQRALVTFRDLKAISYVIALTHNLAILYHGTGRSRDAIDNLRQALNLATQYGISHDAGNTPIELLQEDLDQWETEAQFYDDLPRIYGKTGEIIAGFLLTPDWQVAQNYLEDHKNLLLGEDAARVFDELIEQTAPSSEIFDQLTLHRELLNDIRQYGVKQAFQSLNTEVDQA